MLTKFQVKTKIKVEQEKLDNLIRELIRQNKSLNCQVVEDQELKVKALENLLNSMNEGSVYNGKM